LNSRVAYPELQLRARKIGSMVSALLFLRPKVTPNADLEEPEEAAV
jgi:hypothetical protein